MNTGQSDDFIAVSWTGSSNTHSSTSVYSVFSGCTCGGQSWTSPGDADGCWEMGDGGCGTNCTGHDSCSCKTPCKASKDGSHEWVNAGFNSVKMVCKHCDIEKHCRCKNCP